MGVLRLAWGLHGRGTGKERVRAGGFGKRAGGRWWNTVGWHGGAIVAVWGDGCGDSGG